MTNPSPVPRHLRNPRRAYDEHGIEIPCPTVGSARAAGETTVAVYCEAADCHHDGIVSTDAFPADLPLPDIALRLRCTRCGSRQVRVVKDMGAHYARLEVGGWSGGPFPTPAPKRENGAPAEAEAPRAVAKGEG